MRKKYSEGGIVINMAGECEAPEAESENDDVEEMAKGGMVKRKTAQLKGWGKARRR